VDKKVVNCLWMAVILPFGLGDLLSKSIFSRVTLVNDELKTFRGTPDCAANVFDLA